MGLLSISEQEFKTRWGLHLSTSDTQQMFNHCPQILLNKDHQLNRVNVKRQPDGNEERGKRRGGAKCFVQTAEICCAPVAKILHITPHNNWWEFTHVVHFLFVTARLKSLYCCFLRNGQNYVETLVSLQSCCKKWSKFILNHARWSKD